MTSSKVDDDLLLRPDSGHVSRDVSVKRCISPAIAAYVDLGLDAPDGREVGIVSGNDQ